MTQLNQACFGGQTIISKRIWHIKHETKMALGWWINYSFKLGMTFLHSREKFKLKKTPLHLEVRNTVVEKGGLFLLRTEEIVVELCDMTVCLAASFFSSSMILDGKAVPMSLLFFFIKQVRQRQTSEVYLSLHSSSKIWNFLTFYYFYDWM